MPTPAPIIKGTKYNSLTIIEEINPKISKKGIKQRMVKCLCNCGKIKDYYFSNIKSNLTTSCGCVRDNNVKIANQIYSDEYFLNKKFGRLTIIGLAEPIKTKKNGKFQCIKRFNCICDCGNKTIVYMASLQNNTSKSCGCLRNEIASSKGKHWDSQKKSEYYWLYSTWNAMMNRCYNKKSVRYYRYGQRGIEVYSEWYNYLIFKEWILNNIGERPIKHSLDRINNDGNYEPNNLRWATISEQAKNRRKKYVKVKPKKFKILPYHIPKIPFVNEGGCIFSL